MNTADNHLHRDTENRIKEALFCFTSQGHEPTVAENRVYIFGSHDVEGGTRSR